MPDSAALICVCIYSAIPVESVILGPTAGHPSDRVREYHLGSLGIVTGTVKLVTSTVCFHLVNLNHSVEVAPPRKKLGRDNRVSFPNSRGLTDLFVQIPAIRSDP